MVYIPHAWDVSVEPHALSIEKIFPIGFSRSFETSKEAWDFMIVNKDAAENGGIMGIPYENTCLVHVTAIREPEIERHDRSGEFNRRWHSGDDLPGGVNGMVNHADGKKYDSKASFRKATRRAGCYEVGTDIKPDDVNWKTPAARGVRGDFNVAPALRQALQQTGRK